MKNYLLILLLSFSAANAQTYHEAKAALANGADIQLYTGLSKHPLYPYLAAEYYQKHLEENASITALFKQFYSAPPVKRLHNRWINQQFQQGNWQLVVDNYYDTGSQTANCIFRQSQLLLGNRSAALQAIEQVWFSPTSVSDYCTPVFAEWEGTTQPKNLIKRAKLAYHAGQAGFARRMAEKVNNTEALTILQFVDFLNQPTAMLSYGVDELTATPLHRELLPLALEKLVRKDSSAYATFALQFAQRLKGNQRYQTLLNKLAGYLANRQDPQVKQVYALIKQPNKTANSALLRFLVGSRDWKSIQQLVLEKDNDDMALYWLGRATEALGGNAKHLYQKAAQARSYYGFLAADKLGQAYAFNAQAIVPNSQTQSNFEKNAGLVRGKLLYQAGDPVSARHEILPLAARMDKATKRQLAYWLNRQGFHHDAIYVLGSIRDWNDIRIRFPTPYNAQVKAANHKTQVNPAWIYAIIRQESSMNPQAVSRANAKGLMQLIPSTARAMARDLGITLSGESLFNPHINTQLGSEYLAQMYRRFGNVALASAAYNAGPGRVEQWLPNGVDDMTIWVEKIPFNETRRYVKRVTEYQQVYAKHLGIPVPTLTEILLQAPVMPTLDDNIKN